MRITSAGKVGIGTDSPQAKLDVAGEIKGTNLYAETYRSARTDGDIYIQAIAATDFVSIGTQVSPNLMRIDGGGNVGIGVTNPYNKTHIKTSVDGDGLLLDYAGSNNKYVGVFFKIDNNTSDAYKKGALVWERTGSYNEGRFHFLLNNDDNASNVDLTDSKVTILSTGNFGIGTTNPSAPLSLGNGGAESLELNHNISSSSRILSYNRSNNTYRQLQLDALEHIFKTSSSEKMRITSGGNVGIGTTSPDKQLEILYPSYIDKDTVEGLLRLTGQSNTENSGDTPSAGVGIEFYNKWTGGLPYSIGRISARASQSYDGGLQFDVAQNSAPGQSNFTTAMTILDSGNVGIGTTSPVGKLNVALPADSNGNVASWSSNQVVFTRGGTGTSQGLGFSVHDVDNSATISSLTPAVTWSDLNYRARNHAFYSNGATLGIYQNISGNVGIGTTSPTEKLHVDSIGTNYVARFRHSTGTGYAPGSILLEAGQSVSRGQGVYHYNNVADENWFTGVPYNVNSKKWIVANKSSTIQSVDTAQLTHALMTIDSDTGNVGIGTTSPVSLLHIKGADPVFTIQDTSTGTAQASSTLRLGESGSGGVLDVYWDIKQASDDLNTHLEINHSSNGNHLTILDNGNVGIGTTDPSAKLEVLGQDIEFYSGTGDQSLQLGRGANERLEMYVNDNMGKITAIQDADSNGPHNFILNRIFAGTGSNDFHIQKDGSTQLLINSAGNVGIGTTNPTKNLNVEFNSSSVAVDTGEGLSGGSVGTGVLLKNSNATVGTFANLDFRANNVDARIAVTHNATNNGDFHFILDNTTAIPLTRLFIEGETGNVGIGTTSPNSKLHVSGGDIELDDGYEVKFDINGTVAASEELVLRAGNTDSKIILDGADSAMQFITGNSTAITIDDNQEVGIGTTNPSQLLHVAGNMRLQNQLYDSTNSLGSNNQVLTKVSAGTQWKDAPVNAQMPDNSAPASAANVGTIRYRSTSNTSFVDVSMQTGATTYTWVNIVSNFW